MRRVTSSVSKRFLQRWPLVALIVIAMGVSGACAGEELGTEADFVIEELERTGTIAQPTVFDDQILVYSEDASNLLTEVNSLDNLSDKRDLIRDYLKKQARVDCILDDIEDAVADETAVKCSGHELVEKEDVAQLLDDIDAQGGDVVKRQFLGDYVAQWVVDQRLDSVMEALSQIKNTKAIPLFGPILHKMHDFPILFEGSVLVPKKDIPDLLKQYSALSIKEERQDLVRGYLSQAIP